MGGIGQSSDCLLYTSVTRGVLEQQCSDMLTQFFKELRVRVKEERKARKLLAAQEENKEHGGNVYDE